MTKGNKRKDKSSKTRKEDKTKKGNEGSPKKYEDIKIIIEKINMNQKMEEKKIALPFKKLNKIYDENFINQLSIDKLKIIASQFDVNPKINFRILSYLQKEDKNEYDKYIIKYKYTLNYADAKILQCFKEVEKDIKNDCLKNIGINIKKVQSRAKVKLFSFLFSIMSFTFDLQSYDKNYMNTAEKIKGEIDYYMNEVDLIFKITNNFGNYELKYYTYLELFARYFFEKIEQIFSDKNQIIIDNISDENMVFFDWDKARDGKKENIDMIEFENKKNNLIKFIQDSLKINNKEEEMEIENINNYHKKEGKIIDKEEVLLTFMKVTAKRLNKYKEELFYLFQSKDDEKILKDIEFVFYSLLFTEEESCENDDPYPYCLSNNPSYKNEYFKKSYELFTKNKYENSKIKDELAYVNLDQYFLKNGENPFYDNTKYYKYPCLLEKNIFHFNKDTFDHFKDCMKNIYKSPLLQEIFYLTPELNDFKYPLLDNDIFEEMMENVVFLPYDNKKLHGYTQKEFGKVYIAANYTRTSFSKNEISKVIIKISYIINTLIHEQFKHYLKALLFYNSFRFKKKKRLYSDLSGFQQEQFFINNIRRIYLENENEKIKPVIDGGNRAEIYLYGKILSELSFEQALKMFDSKTWEATVPEHLKKFNGNNQRIKKTVNVSLEEIMKDDHMNDFIKDVFTIFNRFYKCENILTLKFNTVGSEKADEDSSFIDSDKILLNYNTVLENTKITIPDTGTDKNLIKIFEQ